LVVVGKANARVAAGGNLAAVQALDKRLRFKKLVIDLK
jgi:hypothetical protein